MSKKFAQQCVFLAGVAAGGKVPFFNLPEVAFWGRSNVGKSSLINAVTGRKLLAKVSNTPGRTRQINFFEIDQQQILVDFPGYGYAKTSRKDVAAWTRHIISYIQNRINLKKIFLLLDARHELKDIDVEAMELLDELAVPYKIILTKCDKREADLQRWQKIYETELIKHGALLQGFIATSSQAGTGIIELRREICSL